MLEVSPDTVCFIIAKAREFDVKEGVVHPDRGSNAADEDMREVLADYGDDPSAQEIAQTIGSLNVDERAELVALVWLSRDDRAIDEWNDILAEARDQQGSSTARYLLGIPLLADYLEDGLSQHGYDCAEFEKRHL